MILIESVIDHPNVQTRLDKLSIPRIDRIIENHIDIKSLEQSILQNLNEFIVEGDLCATHNNIKSYVEYHITEGIFRSIMLYGIGGAFGNWLEKVFSSEVVSLFNDLIQKIEDGIDDFDHADYPASQYMDRLDLRESVNKAIHNCRTGTAAKTGENICIVNEFFGIMNQLIGTMISLYATALLTVRVNLSATTSFNGLLKVKPKDKTLQNLASTLQQIQKAYITSLNSPDMNKFIAFGEIRRSRITSEFKTEKVKELDNVVKKSIKKAYKVRQRGDLGDDYEDDGEF